MQNVAGVVILYFPDETIVENITSYSDKLGKLYIIDNSPQKTKLVQALSANPGIMYVHDGENKGIAKRLNDAAKLAINDGFEWLLTMDQDSYFDKKNIDKYFNYVSNYKHKSMTAMFGVEFETQKTAPEKPEEVSYLITSGSMLNLRLFHEVGQFDEQLFIDEVDLEYCFRAITKGFSIIKLPFIFLTHHLGEEDTYISLKNLKKTRRALHSSLRIYYMVRNYLYVREKYPQQFLSEDKERRITLLNRIKNKLLYGNEKVATISMIFRAFRDFKAKRMGKKEGG